MRTLSLVTAVADRWEAGLVAVLDRAPGLQVVRRCVDLPDLLAVAASDVADVVLVSATLRGLDLSAVRDLSDAGCAVVAVLDPAGGEDEERRVRQLGVEHVVDATATGPDIVAAVIAAGATGSAGAASGATGEAPDGGGVPDPAAGGREPVGTDAEGSARRGRVVTVAGASGAPGRTTVAVTVAAELAASGLEVLLVDADTHAASVAPVLGLLDEVAGIATACRAAEQGSLDVLTLARIAPVVEDRLRVLTGLPRPDRWTEVRQAALERVLDVARLLVDVVVVDVAASLEDDEELSYDTVAPRRNMAGLTAVQAADTLLVVGAADPVGLQRLVRTVDDLRTAGREPDRLVVTKVRRTALGAGPGRQASVLLERYVPGLPVTLVEWSPDVLDAALLAGQALTSFAPSAPVRTALRGLADELGPERVDAR